ncbi:hypothetical protein JD844_019471, partial [Phrynosoma platyrhinos]
VPSQLLRGGPWGSLPQPFLLFLQKLPFTIPELVQSSPCRSSDGIIYTGKKEDTWFVVDPTSGQKQTTLSTEAWEDGLCPSAPRLYIGRTQYVITMYDTKSRALHWNATFLDYSAPLRDQSNDDRERRGKWTEGGARPAGRPASQPQGRTLFALLHGSWGHLGGKGDMMADASLRPVQRSEAVALLTADNGSFPAGRQGLHCTKADL